MKSATVAEVTSRFAAYLKESEGGPVVVTRNGKPIAVLLGVQDKEEMERLLLAYSPRLRAILDSSRQQIAEGLGIGHEEFWSGAKVSKPSRRRTAAKKRP